MGLVHAVVAALWLPFGHAVDHVAPDLVLVEFSGLDAGDGFDIRGKALFHPMLVVGQGRKGHVYQFVSHGPVGGKFLFSRVLAKPDAGKAGKSLHVTPGRSLDNAVTTLNRNDDDSCCWELGNGRNTS